jgi:hypothetical protein
MDATEIAIYAGVAIVAISIALLARPVAGWFGRTHLKTATAAFTNLTDFTPSDILIYLGSAIAFDPARNRIAIWRKRAGARLVKSDEVGAWHSGTLLTVILWRTTATPMVQLYAGADDAKPFFKVGVLDGKDCTIWSKHLAATFGSDRIREVAVSVLGA